MLRDITNAPAEAVAVERARAATDGWGSALLDLQKPEGSWTGPDEEGWMITIDALSLLREMGVDPTGARAQTAIDRVKGNLRWDALDGRPFFEGETEPCINGAILACGSYFGDRCDAIVERLLDEQLDDGGWNCDAPPSVRSSFNSTIRVLEGLLEYERRFGPDAAVSDARREGHEYLLQRRLFRRVSTGEIVNRKWTRFAFPTTWHYDVLRGLDYLRSSYAHGDIKIAAGR